MNETRWEVGETTNASYSVRRGVNGGYFMATDLESATIACAYLNALEDKYRIALEALAWALPFAEAFDASVVAEDRGGLDKDFYENLRIARRVLEQAEGLT